MSYKCPYCGKIPYPAYDKENKKILWKNVFRIDWIMLIIVLCLIFSAWAYKHDTAKCMELLEKPCDYAEQSGCCNLLNQEEGDMNEGKSSPYLFDTKTK